MYMYIYIYIAAISLCHKSNPPIPKYSQTHLDTPAVVSLVYDIDEYHLDWLNDKISLSQGQFIGSSKRYLSLYLFALLSV